ncbi:phosphatidylserine decarboxylase proenzyme, mitochondrial [Rhagoletis pomonella]|uniref:phosphatidylserine decarboxylase proenzyme, mitochondrial n=1 Tax=Rhagoletis pomonella TaxID=28610 RepID=UPI00177E55D1|nr:phosphatidylserine decarboxylase proenzyme, mitochondrial [Rhagoletis pomonella]
MVSYFVPRGRFLMKAGNLRQAAHLKQVQQQQEPGKWPMLRHFRQSFSTKLCRNGADAESKQGNIKSVVRSNNTLGKNAIKDERRFNKQELVSRSVWTKWTGFLLRWTPVGICLFGVIEWQWHKQKCNTENLPRTASTFQSKVYCSLPLRIISRCWGWLAACYVPVSLRPYIYGWYSSIFGVNLEEALHPDYKYYNSLAEFFTRSLREGVRPIDQKAAIVSPADGRVLHFGSAQNALIEEVKGIKYSVQSFLGPVTWRDRLTGDFTEELKEHNDGSTELYQCVIYLAPGDYHRFHSPAEWQPKLRRHFSGELLSVNPCIATWLPELFCLNERAVYLGKWKHGFFSYTAVGATNVGSVQIYMDESLKTNRWTGLKLGAYANRHIYDETPLPKDKSLGRGELLGQFNMGSTIVLLFEAPTNFQFNIKNGQKIQMGEALGTLE